MIFNTVHSESFTLHFKEAMKIACVSAFCVVSPVCIWELESVLVALTGIVDNSCTSASAVCSPLLFNIAKVVVLLILENHLSISIANTIMRKVEFHKQQQFQDPN